MSFPESVRKNPDKEKLLNELEKLGYLWLGKDCHPINDYTINPMEPTTICLEVTEENLPPINYERTDIPKLISCLGGPNFRSRWAQAGLTASLTPNSEEGVEVDGNRVVFKYKVQVLGGRPVRLTKDSGVCQFCFLEGSRMLAGPDLLDATQNAKVLIDGKFGQDQDWRLAGLSGTYYPDDRWQEEEVLGIQNALFLKLKKRRWIIPSGDEPIVIGRVEDYRGYLKNNVFQEVGPEVETDFWVGETISSVHLAPGHTGIINIAANVGENWVFQLQSLIAKPGTNWPLRTEFYVPPISGDKSYKVLPIRPEDLENQNLIMHIHRDNNPTDN